MFFGKISFRLSSIDSSLEMDAWEGARSMSHLKNKLFQPKLTQVQSNVPLPL